MAQNDNDHPYSYIQNPTPVRTLVSLPSTSRNYWLNRGKTSPSGMQNLASHMERLNSSNPYSLPHHGTNLCHEAAWHRLRIIRAANAATAQVHQLHHHPSGSFLGSPGCEQLVWSHSHHNLEPHCGRWFSLAKDPRGSRLLQRKIHNATPKEIDVILEDLKYHLHELMKHPFGNNVIKKFFLSSNISMAQKNTILLYLFTIMDDQKLKDVCTNDLGNRVIQMILKNIETLGMIYALAIIYAMSSITVALMKNVNGGRLIQQCLKLFPPKCTDVILEEVAKNCVDIATDICGCSVIQKCLDVDEGQAFWQLVNEIISNAVVLAEDPYGNYVVQYLAKKKMANVNAMLISRLRNRYVALSMNKYASNVVEDLLQFSETEDADIIVLELIVDLDFLNVIQNPYGNYVVQTALKCTEGFLHVFLRAIILYNYENLQSHLYGKRVAASAKAFNIHA